MSEALEAPPSKSDGLALLLDFDGTLVELAETPDAIHVPPALPALLARLGDRLRGRLAIVSGRSVADLDRWLRCKHLAVSGSHGLELRLRDGSLVPLAAPPSIAEARGEIAAFAAGDGLLVEEKPFGIALHYRRAPEREAEVRSFMQRIAATTGLSLQHGKMVAELRPHGADKGDALRAIMLEPDFAGARPVFVGDDITDEDAFEAAARLGGGGVLVGEARPTAAKWRLESVADVAAWLERLAQ